MARHLTEDQIEEYREAFSIFDKDGNGRINAGELRNVMHFLGQTLSEAEIHDMIIEADHDNNGTIEFFQFINVMDKRMMYNETMYELDEAFKIFDRDRDGFISKFELGHVMRKLGVNLTYDELEEMIEEADVYDDNWISYEEFVKIMMAKRRKQRFGSTESGATYSSGITTCRFIDSLSENLQEDKSYRRHGMHSTIHAPGFRPPRKYRSGGCRIQ